MFFSKLLAVELHVLAYLFGSIFSFYIVFYFYVVFSFFFFLFLFFYTYPTVIPSTVWDMRSQYRAYSCRRQPSQCDRRCQIDHLARLGH